MTPEDALIELLDRVATLQKASALISTDALTQWPSEAVAAMKAQKLLTKARPASSVVCTGCEHECTMPVHTVTGNSENTYSFIVCDKRNDINQVPVSPEHLAQWRCTAGTVITFISDQLGLRHSNQQVNDAGLREIGVVRGNRRSQMLCLLMNGGLALVAGSSTIPLAEFIGYKDNIYSLDGTMIRQMVDNATTSDERYTPTTTKREARKLDTQTMYESWRKEYRRLIKTHNNMSDVWYSQQIAKLNIAQGRDAETIRKQMKK